MKHVMKRSIIPFQLFLVLSGLGALPHLAFAAQGSKQWKMVLSPTSVIVTPGIASFATYTVTISQGSVLAASTNGVTLSVTVSPPGAGVTASLVSTGVFFGVSSTTTLNMTNAAGAAAQAYSITVTGASTLSGSSDFTAGDINVFTYHVGAPPPGKVWTPAGANTNWSTAGNWNPSGSPGSTDDVQFFDGGGTNAAGVVDNVLDSSLAIGSLTFGQTNNFHTTLIASGQTLTVGGNTNGVLAGTGTAAGDGIVTVNTANGVGGTLVVSNSGAIVTVDQSQPVSGTGNSSTMAILDLSGLDTFKATISRLLVGADTSQALRGACGVLNLAKTNILTVAAGSLSPQIDVGDNTQSGGSPGLPSVLLLGQTNAFFADSIGVGRGKSYSGGGPAMLFNSSFANPVVYFRGTNGAAGRVGTWTIRDASAATSPQTYGTNDFTGGTVSALVDQLFASKGANSALISDPNLVSNGTLTFNPGT